jgi:predicted CoA-binding protein
MSELERAIADFLALGRVAVAGVSRDPRQPANLIFRKLKTGKRRVFAVNPNATSVEGETAYPTVAAIPGGVEGVVVVTTPAAALGVIEDCARAGARQVWLHRSFGDGSVSPAAVERCHELGLRVIPGVCPMMYAEPVDAGHKCMKFLIRVTGKLPRPA